MRPNLLAVIQNAPCVVLFAALLISSGVLATTRDTATLDENSGRTTLTVESPRPVAKAVQTLVKRYEYPITYEDPRYVYDGDLQESTAHRRDLDKFPPGEAPKFIGPMGGQLTVSARSTSLADILNQLVQAQAASARGGHFRVEQTGDVFHVIPTEVKDRNGNWAAQASILDSPISLTTQDRTASELVEAICGAVTTAQGIRVVMGTNDLKGGLLAENGPPQYRLGADDEPARSVLMRALAAIAADRGQQTWLLYYSPQDNLYALNLVPVSINPPAPASPAGAGALTNTSSKPANASQMPGSAE